jgi:cellulose synthase/poly-beta-1,6-N-acetylglucosamine synthase-like glycosyltransferase
METLFWMSAALILYVYAGYPVLLGVWCRIRGSSAHRTQSPAVALPGVSVVIAARNEAARLPARIENLLGSDYPMDRVQIIVASDGSSDDVIAAVEPYGGRLELLMLPARGKANALNAAVMRARHPILIFADARQRFAPDAMRHLVSHFGDPHVGAVSGELILDCEHGRRQTGPASTIADGVGAYWTYEKWIRRHEALVGSTPGVTGAIYAMRRWLWQPLPSDTILDDVLTPMRVVLRGFRVTFDADAHAFDVTAPDAPSELRRKVRTLAGNYQLLRAEPRLLLPGTNPIWVQFMSHKVARLLVPYALACLLISSAVLCRSDVVYAVALAGQAAFYGLAAYGALLDRRGRMTPAPSPEVFREAA